MKLIVTIPLDSNDLEVADFRNFKKESSKATGITLEVGRPTSEGSPTFRQFIISAENFTAEIQE